MKTIFLFCKKYLYPEKIKIIFLTFICLCNSILALFLPYITGDFIDHLSSNTNGVIIRFSLIFFTLSLGEVILGYIINQLHVKFQTNIAYRLNVDAIRHIQSISTNSTIVQDTAYLTQRINHDSNALSSFCLNVIQQIVVNIVKFSFSFTFILMIDKILAVMLLFIITVYIVGYYIFKDLIRNASLAMKESQSTYFSRLLEQISHIKFIQLHGISQSFLKRLDSIFSRVLESSLHYQKVAYLFSSIDKFIYIIATIIIFVLGGKSVMNQNLTVGNLTIILNYFNVVFLTTKYFFQLGQYVQESMVSYNRLYSIFNIRGQTCGDKMISHIESIELRNVTFSYNDRCVFSNFNAKFEKGKIYAITGSNGAGKSTLMAVLMGLFIDEYLGEILFNQESIKSLDMCRIRNELISITEQEPMLIHDSLKNNLLLDENVALNQQRYLELSRLFDFDHFVACLPHGINTIINDKSGNLSGGEKQKIALIRTFLRDPDVLILDEPTSALDKFTQSQLVNYLHDKCNEKIVIILTHHDALLHICDIEIKMPNTLNK